MAEQKIRIVKPSLSDSALKEMEAVLKSGYWTQGKRVEQFEQQLAEYLDIKNVIVVSSGTAALHLALQVLGIGAGDEVIIPAYSFVATVNVVKLCGATPVFVDINTENFCLDTGLLEKAITSNTKVIIPVQEFGAVADMDEVCRLAGIYEIKIIEDAACALGSEFAGKKAGTFGDMGCFSFHPRKIISTGEGGAIVTDNTEYAQKLRMLRNHGCSGITRNEGFILYGLNYRMTDFQAVLGVEQLKTIEEIIRNRVEQANFYTEELNGLSWLQVPVSSVSNHADPERSTAKYKHTYQSYHLLLNKGNRDALKEFLRERGIESNIGAQYLPSLSCLNHINDNTPVCPLAHRSYSDGLVIPIGSHLSRNDLEEIILTIKEYGHEFP